MKNKNSFLLVVLLCLIHIAANGQELTTKEVHAKLIKSWTATETGRPQEPLIPKNLKEVMVFQADGIVRIEQESKMMGMMTYEARWEFDEQKQNLILKLTLDGRTETVLTKIVVLQDNRLVLESHNKVTVYVPTASIEETAAVVEETAIVAEETNRETTPASGLNPVLWTGSLNYNLVELVDLKDNVIAESVEGTITLEREGDVKIIRKVQGESVITWRILSQMEIAGITRYSSECSDPKYTGEISFQGGTLLLEVYKPEYMSYNFIRK